LPHPHGALSLQYVEGLLVAVVDMGARSGRAVESRGVTARAFKCV
jgi:hypothetical protein